MIKATITVLIVLYSLQAEGQQLSLAWQQVASGVWKAQVGRPQKISLLAAAGSQPATAALQRLGDRTFPLQEKDCYAELQQGSVYLRFPLAEDEQLFGLGLNFKSVNQRERILDLHVDHYNGIDNGRTHAPVPFYVSDRGYGVLVNSAQYMTVYAGTAVRKDAENPPRVYDRNANDGWQAQPLSDAVEFRIGGDGAEIYVFAGNTAMEAVQRYNLFNGGGALPPKWGLGFTQRVPTLFSDKDVEEEVKAFKEHQFPLEFIGLEPGWQSSSYPCTFEWDKRRFPDPAVFAKRMLDDGIRLNLWINPYLSPASSHYGALKPLSGSHLVWNGLVPDINLPAARDVYESLFKKQHIDIGVSGYKIDEIDGYDNWLWPDVATFPSGISAEQMRQVFGVAVQKMTLDWFRQKNQRTYGLARASNAGASSFPYVIYNDYYDHRDFITAMCNSSFIGVLWTPEVRASQSAEEWLRRMQSVCFSPMAMLNAWSDGTKPWTFPEVAKQVQEVAMLRMQLFPYIYSAFAQYYFEGKPPVRAMNLVDGFAYTSTDSAGEINSVTNPYALAVRKDCKDQFMLGDCLLVAPMFAGESKRQVILPRGKWYDFYSGRYAGSGEVITITPGLDRIPLYVKDGSIIPMTEARQRTPAKGEVLPLELRHYGESEGTASLYDDDGETYNYEKGDFVWYKMKVTKDRTGRLKGRIDVPAPGKLPHTYNRFTWKFMTVPGGGGK